MNKEIAAQYLERDKRRLEFSSTDSLSTENACWNLLHQCQLLINHGRWLKKQFSLPDPVLLSIDFAQQAIDLAPVTGYLLRAAAYLSLANARRLLEFPPYAENVNACRLAQAEVNSWRQSEAGKVATEEELTYANAVEYSVLENQAIYLHYADDFESAIRIYEALLDNKELITTNSQRFSVSVKLANVLNDASLLIKAREYLFSGSIELWITSDEQWFRLHAARSHTHALTGKMVKALSELTSALHYFNDAEPESRGNVLIRAARYYINFSAYEHAATLLPDLIVVEDKYSGMDHALNMASVRAALRVAHGTEEQASDALAKLKALVRNVDEVGATDQWSEYRWVYHLLLARCTCKYSGSAAALAELSSLPHLAGTTIRTHASSMQSLLLVYCEVALEVAPSLNIKPQIDALLAGSICADQWDRWRVSLCAARERLFQRDYPNAILWSKIACHRILSLSVPLLQFQKQRERVAELFITPFVFLENALCVSGRIAEAQAVRSYRISLECKLLFTTPDPGHLWTDSTLDPSLPLSNDESVFFELWNSRCDSLTQLFEQGKSLAIAAEESGLAALLASAPLDGKEPAEECRPNLPPTATVVQKKTLQLGFWIDKDEVWLTTTRSVKPSAMRLNISPEQLRRKVFNLRVAIDENTNWRAIALDLYKVLVEPVTAELGGIEQLIISAADALRVLPFAALFDGERFLIEKFVIVNSHAGRVAPSEVLRSSGAMLVGTRCHQVDEPPLQPAQELAIMRGALSVKGVLLDDQWTKKSFAEQAQKNHSVVHVCCHFAYQAHNPSDSRFLLSAGRQLPVADLVLGNNWRKVELLFLATCNSAVGSLSGAEKANLSLADIFVSAGVNRVVASYRPVNDNDSVLFCSDFYAQLKRHGSVEKSLRSAQCRALQRSAASGSAGWTAYGCWARAT